MKLLILKIIVFVTIIISGLSMIPALTAFETITTSPEEWMGGVSPESTLVWFAVIFLGFGFLAFETLLALVGFIFSQKKRLGAFWLFKLPGILGIILSVFLAFLIIGFEIDWKNHLFVILYILLPSLIFAIFGNTIRKLNPKKRNLQEM